MLVEAQQPTLSITISCFSNRANNSSLTVCTMANQGQKFSFSLLLPVLPVMIPGLVIFTLASLALMGTVPSLASFLFTHLLLLVAVFWTALDRKRYEPVVCFMVVLVVSAITDIVPLALTFNTLVISDLGRFTVAVIIINLLCKPVTLILSILALYSRRKNFGITFNLSGTIAQSESAQPNQELPTHPVTSEYRPLNVVPSESGQPGSYPPPQPAY